MILGSDKAKVGHGLLGETFKSTVYPVEIDDKTYNLYDTAGLGEYSGGTVDNPRAIRNLYRLVAELSNSGGVNLLVFIFKCGRRLTKMMHKNYALFHRGFCDSKVPIVIVVTGCENVEPTMDVWWIDNERSFTQAGMSFNGHACVCAFRGRITETGDHRDEGLVRESVGVVKQLVVQNCMPNGWKKVRRPQSRRLKFENLPKHRHRLFGFNRLLDPLWTSFNHRKYQLSTPASTIASQMSAPPWEQRRLSKGYYVVMY